MKYKLQSIVALTAAMTPGLSNAIGLGEITLLSRIGETLVAEVPLLSTAAEAPQATCFTLKPLPGSDLPVVTAAKSRLIRRGDHYVVQLIGTDSTGYQTMAVGADGRYYTVRFFERGFVVPLMVGKIFTLSKKSNLNSGIYVELGTQFFQHKINVIAVGDNVPYLSKPYLKGYDRLTNGFGLVEGFGYRYFGNNRFTNFFIGAELSQNFTQNRRDLNFDTGVKDDRQRMDLLYNLKVGWTFPIYRSAPESEYYY